MRDGNARWKFLIESEYFHKYYSEKAKFKKNRSKLANKGPKGRDDNDVLRQLEEDRRRREDDRAKREESRRRQEREDQERVIQSMNFKFII